MSEVENETVKMLYRNDDIDYDVSKLNIEAQQAFMMLAEMQNKVLREAEVAFNVARAAQAQYNLIIKNNLNEEGKITVDGPVSVDSED